jgi:ribosomal-protein-alanine N-acetyltransferase
MEISLPIETPRLLLRRYRLEDAENIFQDWASDPEVAKYLSWKPHQSLADTYAFLEQTQKSWQDRSHLALGMEGKETGRLIGGIGFGYEARVRVQFGYAIGRKYWGQGYTSEALRALIPVVFRDSQIHRAYALCYVKNQGSARVMEKAGLSFEGVLRQYFLLPNVSPQVPCDMACYSLLRGRI